MNDSNVKVGIGKLPMRLQSAHNRILIKNGTVVNDDEMFAADVYVEDGIIKQVGKHLSTPGGIKVIDAGGRLIIPGGIDTHTHMELHFMGTTSCDDFYTGTRAALAGGTTMIIDFAMPEPGKSLVSAYNDYRAKADPKVCCDYALHVIVHEYNDKTSTNMADLVSKGVNSFKVYLAYSFRLKDEELFEVFKKCKELGALAMVHAENGHLIDIKAKEVFDSGVKGPEGHLQARPEDLEADATNRAIVLADQASCPLYVVHVMSKGSAEKVSQARREGKIVFGEPIAAGLGSNGSHYQHKCWRHAAGYVMSPPIRDDVTTPEFLMKMLANGELECTGTDHCVFNSEQKSLGKDDFRKIPNGINGVEDRMCVIWEKGVETGILDPCRFVAVTSTNAAKVFNIYPRKGRIAVGSDADIVIWDPKQTRVISANNHHSKVDFNIFEGMTCHGVPIMVMTGGRIVLDTTPDSDIPDLRVTQGSGRFVETPTSCHYVYGRVQKRNELKCYHKVLREEDKKINVTVSKSAEQPTTTPQVVTSPVTTNDSSATIANKHSYRTNSSGVKNQQESSIFSTDANNSDSVDSGRKHYHSSVRTHHPPGGASSGSLW